MGWPFVNCSPTHTVPPLFSVPFSHLRHSRQIRLHDDLAADVRAEDDSLRAHEQVDGLEDIDEHLVLAVFELASLAPVHVSRDLARDAGVVAGGTLGRLNNRRERTGTTSESKQRFTVRPLQRHSERSADNPSHIPAIRSRGAIAIAFPCACVALTESCALTLAT